MSGVLGYEWVTREPVDVTAIGGNKVLIARVLRPGAIVTDVTEEGDFLINGNRVVPIPDKEFTAPADWVLVGAPDWSIGRTFRFHPDQPVPVEV